jgi:formylglycine-generating enzyme required for sulfatase activity/truncated hemoglobin YjbI
MLEMKSNSNESIIENSSNVFTKIGGIKKVSQIINDFYKKVTKSKVISPYLENIDLDNLIKIQIKIFSAIMGGSSSYNKEQLKNYRNQVQITENAFSEFIVLLEETFKENTLDPQDIADTLAKVMEIKDIMLSQSEASKESITEFLKNKLEIEYIEKLPELIISPLYQSIIEFDKNNYKNSLQYLYNSYCNILLRELYPAEGVSKEGIGKTLPELIESTKSKKNEIDDSVLHKFNQIIYSIEDPSPDIEVLKSCINDAKYVFGWYVEFYKSKNLEIESITFEEVNNQILEDIKKTNLIEIPKDFKNSINMEFALIPAGEFVMGALPTDKDANNDEHPIHKVRITQRFYISKFLTTQGNWKAIMNNNPSYYKKLGEDHPVERVSWYLVQDFIKKLNEIEKLSAKDGYRLPTEAEWEYACKAGSHTKFFHGNNSNFLEEYAWFGYNSNRTTHPVGTKKPNEFGIFDTLGNVREWCQDWYGPTFYDKSTLNDPKGPPNGDYKVMRGGSWYCVPRLTRTTQRYHHTPASKSFLIGFRLVKQIAN